MTVSTPHARVWSGAIFGGLFLASFMAISEAHLPYPDAKDPVGLAVCLVTLVLTIRSLRLALVIRPGVLVVRGYFLTRRLNIADIDSISVIDYPGPWWLDTDRLVGLRVDRTSSRPLTVWGVTGSRKRVGIARRTVRDGIKKFAAQRA